MQIDIVSMSGVTRTRTGKGELKKKKDQVTVASLQQPKTLFQNYTLDKSSTPTRKLTKTNGNQAG